MLFIKPQTLCSTLILILLAACNSQPAVLAPTSVCCTATPLPTLIPAVPAVTSAPVPLEFNITHAFGNPQRTSAYDFAAIRELPAVLWTKRLGSSASISAPVFVDGVLYVGAQNGQLYALNTETGAEIWHTASGRLPSAVAVAGELVFNNDGIGRTQAFRRDTGEKIWSVEISGAGYGAPLVIENIVYAVSERGVYALDRLTGKKVWEKNTGSHRGFVSSPAFSDGTLYFGVGPTFYALDAQSGQEVWTIQSKTWFYGAALADHFVYVGNDDGYFYALNSKTGEEIWKSPLAGAGWSSPAIANGHVYVGNRDQHLYAFDAQTGSELWKTELEDWATSDPLISDDVIYVGSGNHENHEGPRQLYALDARTGAELWKFRADSRLLTAPALSANTIYVLSISGTVYALKAPTPTSTFVIGSVEVSEKDDMKLLYVPAGEFTMGSENGDDNEKPVHVVLLDAFWIDQIEITNGKYALCVNDGGCDVPGAKESLTRPNYYGEAKYNNYPVIFVDWNMAKTYCEWAGRRLPTEAEWEKAARGAEAFTYPWGNAMPDKNLLNYKDFVGDTTEVGIYPKGASPYGALDMAGNVWEWVNDWFAPDYYKNSSEANPPGPSTGRTHALRGGSWNLNDDLVRSTSRGTHPSEPNLGIGFRCAMDTSE
ncbi:MAG TPA: PQQ-binding-like beta-propeller repeat protein [Anaerolineales bacterium]|nr:PQQ-binding-like beta-propeller repeat protein [Anaerolineales bacterium]